MKKTLAILLCACLLVTMALTAFASFKSDAKLSFNADGKFKIMVLADVQDVYPLKDDFLIYLNEALDFAQPDLVVFDGDNIVCSGPEPYEMLLTPLTDRGIPFTFVFGNHDDECSDYTKEEILAQYQKFDGCLAYDADPSLHGCATHNLPILSSDGSEVAFNLWLMDSGDYDFDKDGVSHGYDWVRKDQIRWYETTRDALKEENGGELVPSLMFQHIIPQECVKSIYVKGFFPLGDATFNFNDGSYYTVLPDMRTFDGYIFEKSCPGNGTDGQWQALVDGGDVLGVVVGHDHVNNFVADVDGVDLIQTAGTTYHSYYNDMMQGARIIELDENTPWSYETYNLTTSEMALKDGSGLPDAGERSKADYFVNYYFEKIFNFFVKFLQRLGVELFGPVM